ncbi:hypothetical protein [Thalassobaculum sp.]|uniref:hypothetical protein n=1 Tax=Thalassobaculum sp. TaxID=2022740 RepID=UPI003B5A0AD7
MATGRTTAISGAALAASYGAGSLFFGFGWAWFPANVWHFVDQTALLTSPFETLMCLHTQPPTLNALLWIALTLSDGLGVSVEQSGFLLLAAFGWLGLWSLHRSVSLMAGARLADLLTLMTALSPCFMRHGHQFFYTIVVFALVAFAHLQIIAYLRSPGGRRFVTLSASLLFLVLTRSLFPFPWAVLCLMLVLGLGWWATRETSHRSLVATATAFVVAIAVFALLPVKNYVLHGAFTSSSWQGLNLTRAIPNDRSSDLMVPYADADIVASEGGAVLPQNACRTASVGAAERRTVLGAEGPNMHHDRNLLAMRPLSKEGVEWRISHPVEYFDNIVRFYGVATRPSFSRQFGGTSPEDPAFAAYTAVVFAPLFAEASIGGGMTLSVFGLVILPAFVITAGLGILICRRHDKIRASVLLIGLLWVAWTVVLPILTDGWESPRMRFGSLAPMIVTAAALVVVFREKIQSKN